MTPRYIAVGLQNGVYSIEKPSDSKKNIERIGKLMDYACHNSWEYPVKLVTLAEQAIQGFTDTRRNLSHVETARTLMNTTVPGEETDLLGEKARQMNLYIVGNVRGVEPEFPDRYFNIAFIVGPNGRVVHKYHKLQIWPGEPTVTPHDLYDKWIEVHGRTLDTFFPVADTDIGRIGTLICNDGSYPETFRGLAMNGAEVITHSSYPLRGGDDPWYNIIDQGAALANTCYVIGTRLSHQVNIYPDYTGEVNAGEGAHIYDFKGSLVARNTGVGPDTWVSGIVDIAALRDYRKKAAWGNFIKDLRTEIYQLIYDHPIYPKNLYLEKPPSNREARVEVFKNQAKLMVQRKIFADTDEERKELVEKKILTSNGEQ